MSRPRFTLVVAPAVVAVLLGSARWTLRAQDDPRRSREPAPARAVAEAPPGPAPSVQDALLRPFTFPFAEDTTLEAVAAHFRKALHAPVVLDLAALGRQELTPESTVRLHLQGVRLKTGLKLLLDQVGLTYRVVPEDNLLILTDTSGAEDPMERVLDELKSLHRDVHDLKDAVEEVYQSLAPDEDEPAPAMRKPTIIEEIPADPKAAPKPEPKPEPRVRPGL
jgi:hypothetical protein